MDTKEENNVCCSICLCNIIFELTGYIIYLERAILKKDSNEKEKKDNCCKLSCQLCCETLNNYCSNLHVICVDVEKIKQKTFVVVVLITTKNILIKIFNVFVIVIKKKVY